MAGSQDPSENPVAINVVPMVDVIFCLCVFFMCSFKFKQLEGKFESWLPKEDGDRAPAPPEETVDPEIRVALFWDDANGRAVHKFGTRRVESSALEDLIRDAHDDWTAQRRPDVGVTIDADARVPWQDVVTVMNSAHRAGVVNVEFAYGPR